MRVIFWNCLAQFQLYLSRLGLMQREFMKEGLGCEPLVEPNLSEDSAGRQIHPNDVQPRKPGHKHRSEQK